MKGLGKWICWMVKVVPLYFMNPIFMKEIGIKGNSREMGMRSLGNNVIVGLFAKENDTVLEF